MTDRAVHSARYEVLGVGVRVVSALPAALDLIDSSYAPFRAAAAASDDALVELRSRPDSESFVVETAERVARSWPSSTGAALDLLEQLVKAIVSGLHRRGLYGIHAAALGHRGRSVMILGDSGSGKSTMALALAARGLELLSDELAILDPRTGQIHPYARLVHVRPGTPELVDGLDALTHRPRMELGGGIAWALARDVVGTAGTVARPLGWVLVLEPRRDPIQPPQLRDIGAGLAALHVLRGTWAASVDFAGTLEVVAQSIADLPSAAVSPGLPMETADAIISWLDAHDAGA